LNGAEPARVGALRIEEVEPLQAYRFHLNSLEEDITLLSFEQEKLTQALAEFIDDPWSSANRQSLSELATFLIPRRVKEELLAQCGPLFLKCDDTTIPWEALLSREVPLATSITTRKVEEMVRRPKTGSPKGLVHTCEPELVPRAPSEERACIENWAFSTGPECSTSALLTEATHGCLYLVSYITPDGLRLSADMTSHDVVKRSYRQERTVCRLAFVHALQLNTMDQISPVALPLKVAEDLISLGIETVIINCWEPNCDEYPGALGTFWESLKTKTVGQALSDLKGTFSDSGTEASSNAFLLFGNPDLKQEDLVPMVIPSPMSVTTAPNMGKPDYRLLVTAGPEKGRQIPIFARTMQNGRPLTIGRPGLKRCDLELDDPSIPNRIAQLEFQDVGMILRNLTADPEAVRLNGLPLGHNARVEGWETIEFGQTKLEMRTGSGERIEPPSFATSRGKYALKPVSKAEDSPDWTHPLEDSFTVVGRQGAFPLGDPSVSRQHAAVMERDGFHLLTPLGDARVVLNGVEVHEETELSVGDQIRLSQDTILEYVEQSEPSS
jgi:hypothetical protein